MDELSLIVEGIINKVKRLSIQNEQLYKQMHQLQQQLEILALQLEEQMRENDQLQQRLAQVQVAKYLNNGDTLQARQKVNELLREVEKCYALLNR